MDDKLIPVSAAPSVTTIFNEIVSNIENYFRKYPPGQVVTPTPVRNTLKYNGQPVRPAPKIYDITDIIESVRLMQSDKDRKKRRSLIYNVTKYNIFGSGDDFERLIKFLFSLQDYYSALILCLYCLKTPGKMNSVTLLSLIIELCRHLGQETFPIADTCMYILQQHARWDVEVYSYCVAYLQAKAFALQSEAVANLPGNHGKIDDTVIKEYILLLVQAAEMAEDCKKSYPYDETGYFLCAKVSIQQGSKEKAKKQLRQVIFEMLPQGDPEHPPQILKCPKCCLLLLTLYDNEEDTKLIQEIADKYISIEGSQDLFFVLYRQAEAIFYEQGMGNCSEFLPSSPSEAVIRLINRYKMAEEQIPPEYLPDIYPETIWPHLDYRSSIQKRCKYLSGCLTLINLKNPQKEL